MRNTNTNASLVAVSPRAAVLWRVAGVVGFALLTAAGAQVAIPLPHTPVPLTLQTLVVLLAGVTLGPRLGMASMALYLLLGAVGYHVFAENRWGLQTLVGANGGYLLGFLLAQPVIGRLTRRNGAWRGILSGVLAGDAIIFTLGLTWLSCWLHLGWQDTLAKGLWPFVAGDILKMAVAVVAGILILPRTRVFASGPTR